MTDPKRDLVAETLILMIADVMQATREEREAFTEREREICDLLIEQKYLKLT